MNNHSQPTSYRPLPPREYALGSEIRRTDASFVPTLQSSSSLRRSGTTGSQYSWSSRSGSQNREGRTGSGGRGSGSADTHRLGGGLSSININMADSNSGMTEEPGNNIADELQQESSAMGRISEEDASGSILMPSHPPNVRSSQETLEIFERSDMFNRSESDSIGSKNKGFPYEIPNPDSRLELLDTMTPLALPTMTGFKSPESVSTMGESVDPNMVATARFGRLLQQCRELTQTLSESTVDGATKSSKSDTLQQDAAATTAASFEPMKLDPKQTIQTSTREYNTSEITMDPPLKTSINEKQDSITREGKSLVSANSLDSGHVYNDVTNAQTPGINNRNRSKSLISELSLGVDQMYNDDTESFQQGSNISRSPYCGSPVSDLSYSGRRGDDILANLTVKPAAAPAVAEPKGNAATVVEKDKPAFMKYLSKIKTEDIDTRSWLSDTDGEPTPKVSTNPHPQTFGAFKAPVPISGQGTRKASVPITKPHSDTNNIFNRVATAQPKSPQSSFLSTDFSDDGDSGGLLVGFGKRRSASDSSSSSSSSGSSESSDSTDDSDSSSSSESQSGEITDETEPSYPTIARSGIRLNHQDDDVSALSFGGASALVASAPSRKHLAAPALPPQETCISETSSTPSKSLKSQEVEKESSPESGESKKSGKSTGSGLVLPAAGIQRRRSSLSGAETFSFDTGSDAQNPVPRRSTFGDLPQLEEEAESQASSISLGVNNEEMRGISEAIILGHMCQTSSHASSKSSINADPSPRSASRLSRSSSSANPSSKLNAAGIVDSSLPPASSSRLSKSSSEDSGMKELQVAEVLNPSSAQPGECSDQTGGQQSNEQPTVGNAVAASPIDNTKQPTTDTEESKICEHQQLGRVAEDSSGVQDFVPPLTCSHFPSENTHPNEFPRNGMVYDDEISVQTRDSVTSSLSSVVSKARVSFQMSCTSGLSGRSREEIKSTGSFRKSASDLIAERQSSKASLGSNCSGNSKKVGVDVSHTEERLELSIKTGTHESANNMIANHQDNKESVESSHVEVSETLPGTQPQLDLSLKSGSKESGGDLYEGFPQNVDDELIRSNRKETTQFHPTLDATDEIDARKPWRTGTHKVKNDEDSTAISDAASSTNHTPQDESLTKQEPRNSDSNSALSDIINSTAALMYLGAEVDNMDTRDEDKDNNPRLSPKEPSSVVPKHLRRTSTESSITEWDFSGQNRASHSNAITHRKSPSASLSSQSPEPIIDSPSPSLSAAAAEKIDESFRSITTDDDAHQNERLSNEANDTLRNEGLPNEVDTADIPDDNKQNQASTEPILSDEGSPLTQEKKDLFRKSMRDTAHEMSVKLDNFFLSRSQLQVKADDFESRSFEDLSSASGEDKVLAFLRDEHDEKGYEYSPQDWNGQDTNNAPDESLQLNEDTNENDDSAEEKTKSSKSRATNLLKTITTRIRSSVLKPPEDDASEDFIPVEIGPIFPEPPGDDSDGPRAHVGSIDSEYDEHVESGFVFQATQEDRKENSDSAKGHTEQVEANEDKANCSIVDFFRSKHFLIALGCFVLVIIIVVSVTVIIGSKEKQAIPSLQPTIGEVVNPPSPPTPSIWVQVGNDIEGKPGDELGFSVSSSELGNRFIVGSRRSSKDNLKNRGAIRIYEFDELSGSYTLVAEIHGEQAGDQCGYSVSMSKDGKRIAVGSLGSDKNGINSGQVRVFEDTGTKEWVLVSEFLGEVEGSLFGASVSLSQNGKKLAVGAPHYGNAAISRIGRVYVYEEIGEQIWKPVGKAITGMISNDLLGWSVSFSPNSMLLAVGAPGEDSVTRGGYVRVCSYETNQWSNYGEMISAGLPGDRFGFSVQLGGNETIYRLAIGAPGTNSVNGDGSGYAGIYEQNKNAWLPVGDGISGDWGENLGYDVSLTPNADRMIVGVPNKLLNGLPAGEIQVLDLIDGSLKQTAQIIGDSQDFGVSVAISYDGRLVYGGAALGDLVRVFGEL